MVKTVKENHHLICKYSKFHSAKIGDLIIVCFKMYMQIFAFLQAAKCTHIQEVLSGRRDEGE